MSTVLRMALAALLAAAAPAWSQAFPTGPMRIVVPFNAGGSTDIMARTVAQRLNERVRQPVVVENRPGANGTIGTAFVAKSAPDGHTMLLVQASFVSNPSLFRNLPYNQARDLAAVTNLASGPLVLVVHPSLPVTSAKQLIALARAHPGEINFGSPGTGSISHLACELFNMMAGIKMTHIPYKGTGGALADMLSGQISFYAPNLFLSLPYIKAGRLRALGVTSPQRSPIAPELPTIDETGLRGYESTTWYGVFVPGATPRDLVSRLQQELAHVVNLPDVKERLTADGLTPIASTPDQFAEQVTSETAKTTRIIQAIGLKATD
ncbi:MAG: Tripartite tricarboxylate transporter substrate binding protein [Anaerolineales bacterium]|nr:Tripartite tricarboxylate transporter substrate binding protein [Anaerolineales bacterium]